MAKEDHGKEPVITPLEIPSQAERARLKAAAASGRDDDLPPGQRRNRSKISEDRDLQVDDEVSLIDGNVVSVLASGRGVDTFQAGWVADGSPYRGTFFASQVLSVQRGGVPVARNPNGDAKGGTRT